MKKSQWLLSLLLPVSMALRPLAAEEELLFVDEAFQVGEGELVFLDARDYPAVMHSHNRITITEQSLADGFVAIHQCYEHLDAVPRMDIVYRYERLRAFSIASYQGIELATVEGQAVSLNNVQKNATLCVAVEAAILHSESSDHWVLRNGPFHRQFFDGFFPFHVTLQVSYPDALALQYTRPEAQPGVRIEALPGQVTVESYFAGMLSTEIGFVQH